MPHLDLVLSDDDECVMRCHLSLAGEAITGSRLNRTESPSPSLLNTVYSEAGWFRVIFPVISQTSVHVLASAVQVFCSIFGLALHA